VSKSNIRLCSLLFITLSCGIILSSSSSSAVDETVGASITVSSACTMSRESTVPHIAANNAASYTTDIGTTKINTICNDADGYAIYAVGFSNDEYGNTNMYGSENNQTIPTGTASGNTSNWSMKIIKDQNSYNPSNLTITTGYDSYHSIPSVYTKIVSFTGATDITKGSTITTTYAVRVSSTQLADTYTGQVKYTMVHPANTRDLGMMALQEVTPSNCPTTRILAYDSRDNQEYYIQKITTGAYTLCWMTTNLNLAGGTALYSDTSNVPDGYPSSGNTPYYTLPTSSRNGFTNDSVAYVYNSNSTQCGNNSPCYSYYSYSAATAGTNPASGNAEYDICPKGWRLPNQAEYTALLATYNKSAISQDPWFGSYSGYYWGSNDFRSGGGIGRYWSSTAYSNTGAYRVDLGTLSSHNVLGANNVKHSGSAVRCVAKEQTIVVPTPEPVYTSIQSIKYETCPTTPTTVYDTRDNQLYTIQKLADGNCWMLDNLRLGTRTLKVLTPNDTNITSDFILPASIESNFNSYTTPQINIDSKNDIATYGNGENKIGVYYNYCAATAGTYCFNQNEASDDASQDICPKGWRLPTGGESGEYQTLLSRYSNYTTFKDTLHATLSGYFLDSTNRHQNKYGSFWTSTKANDDHIYSLDARIASVPSDWLSNRNSGISVRCVAKINYIQDITAANCPTERTHVYDKRDMKDYYIQKITTGNVANCWMTTNLKLAGQTPLYSDTSNVPDGYPTSGGVPYYTLPQSSTNNAGMYYTNNTDCRVDVPCYGYYSYQVATAGTNPTSGDSVYDVCPKGWKLPTANDFTLLINNLSISQIYNSPWYAVDAGHYDYNRMFSMGVAGYYVSSTVGSDTYQAKILWTDDSKARIYTTGKLYLWSVRCITK